jgi:hypothetical protein
LDVLHPGKGPLPFESLIPSLLRFWILFAWHTYPPG